MRTQTQEFCFAVLLRGLGFIAPRDCGFCNSAWGPASEQCRTRLRTRKKQWSGHRAMPPRHFFMILISLLPGRTLVSLVNLPLKCCSTFQTQEKDSSSLQLSEELWHRSCWWQWEDWTSKLLSKALGSSTDSWKNESLISSKQGPGDLVREMAEEISALELCSWIWRWYSRISGLRQ